jgi:hypothetical protein
MRPKHSECQTPTIWWALFKRLIHMRLAKLSKDALPSGRAPMYRIDTLS